MRALSRRRFLRGLGGAAVALPLLQSLDTRPVSAASPPKRLVIFFTPNGTVKDRWRPVGAGAGESDFTLSDILEPLSAHRDDVLILDGIDMESSYHGPGDNAHWSGLGHMLTGTSLIDLGGGVMWGGGVSIDQRIADAISQEGASVTRLRSLELGVEEHAGTVSTRMSYLGPLQPVPPEASPRKAYNRIFEDVPAEVRAARRSVLDTVGEDLTDLRWKVSADDRQRIDAHLTAVRDIEKRLDLHKLSGATCAMPEPPEGAAADFVAAGDLQRDLLVLALACDVTRVASLMWSCGVSMTAMSWLGIKDPHHDLSHKPPEDPDVKAALTAINRWYAGRFASLLEAMKAVPEGDGTLLDHACVLWCNELSIGDVHSRRGVPFVIAGRCGGYFKTGRFFDYGGAATGVTHNNLLVSICNAMELNVNTFGDPAFGAGPLPGLTGA